MKSRRIVLIALLAMLLTPLANAQLVSGLEGSFGSTVGPDGALYVTERVAGRVSRVDPWTGDVTPFADGLPIPAVDIGANGAVDVAFVDGVAYALVTVVGPGLDFLAPIIGAPPGFAGDDAAGIYRIDGPATATLVADLGQWSVDHPPLNPVFIAHGVQYAMDPFRGGLLVSDGHHNRILWVSPDGEITEFATFDNIVPTGLEVFGKTVFLSQAGPVPHLPENGKVVAIDAKSGMVAEVANGAPLAVDVEFGPGRTMYVLAQGIWTGLFGGDGSPADPFTGSLHKIGDDGSLTEVAAGLNMPTSMEFIGNTAYIVTLTGEVWTVDEPSGPPFGPPPRKHKH